MDSKLIFQASGHMQGKVTWIKLTDTEWTYFGAGKEVDRELVIATINSHMVESKLYVAYQRNESFETSKEEVMNEISQLVGYHDFIVWDTNFIMAIEFNHIGVFRKGKVKS